MDLAFEVTATKRRKELQESVKLAMRWNREDVVTDELRSFGFKVEMVGRKP